MGKLWKNCSNDELVLHYNGIQWGLRERLHCQTKSENGKNYVIPQYTSTSNFDDYTKPGMLGAQKTIEEIWKQRCGEKPIPKIDLERISEEEFGILSQGWETYKAERVSLCNFEKELHERGLPERNKYY